MKQIVDRDTICTVLEKAGQNSIVVAADRDKSIIPLQGLGRVVAKCGGKNSAGSQCVGDTIQ
jgi:hypothetical protein